MTTPENSNNDTAASLEEQAMTILTQIEKGGRSEELLPLVYDQLRKLAQARLNSQPQGQTLQATALVHEAYLRVSKNEEATWDGKGHFFAAAAESMRRVIIDRIRRKSARKHGGDLQRVEFEELELPGARKDSELLDIHEHLDDLSEEDEESAELVKLRFFVGLTMEEAAEALGMSTRTAKRRWAYARAWLFERVSAD